MINKYQETSSSCTSAVTSTSDQPRNRSNLRSIFAYPKTIHIPRQPPINLKYEGKIVEQKIVDKVNVQVGKSWMIFFWLKSPAISKQERKLFFLLLAAIFLIKSSKYIFLLDGTNKFSLITWRSLGKWARDCRTIYYLLNQIFNNKCYNILKDTRTIFLDKLTPKTARN